MAGPALGMGAVVFLTLARALLTRSVFYERDILAYWYPGIEVFVRAIAEGTWPVWNPYGGFGTPLLADPNFQLAYPLTWLNLLLPRAAYYKLFVTVHCLVAGLGAQALARRQGRRPLAAFVAGAAFAASGPLLSAANLFHHFTGAAFMPWVLWALQGALGGATRRAWLTLGVAGALLVLAGSGDLCLMTAIAAGIQVLVHLSTSGQPIRTEVPRLARVVSKGGALALLLSAIQWLPTFALTIGSTRVQQNAPTSTYWSLHPLSLADLIVPRLLSDLPMGEALRGILFESREPLLVCLYWGLPVITLAVLAAAGPGRTWALLAGGFFILAALGRNTPLDALILALPGMSFLRYPVKFLLPASLFSALLAAGGVETLEREWNARDRRWGATLAAVSLTVAALSVGAMHWLGTLPTVLAPWLEPGGLDRLSASEASLGRTAGAAAIGAALLWLRSRYERSPSWLAPAAVVLLALDLVTVGAGVNRLAPPELAAYRPPAVARLASAAGDARIYAARRPPACWKQVRVPPGWDERWARALAVQQALSPPAGARWGLYGSYDGEFSGLGSARAAPVVWAAGQYEGTPFGLRLLRLGAVDYVVAVGPRAPAGLSPLWELPSVYPCPLRVLRVEESLPRAYVVDGVRSEPPGDVLPALADPAFDPSHSVLLPSREAPRPPSPGFRGEARVVKRRADAVAVEVEASAPAYLVLVESFAPGWRATVDGQPVEVLPANVLFRGVPMPAGRHLVELVYRPAAVTWGAALSTLGLLLVALVPTGVFPERGPCSLPPPASSIRPGLEPRGPALRRILVVDDEQSMRELLAIMLKKEGFEVLTADSRGAAAGALAQGPVDLVVTDVRLPDGDGIEILRHVKAASPDTVVIVMTAYGSAETAVAALKLGAHDYLLKPFDVDELKIVIRNALERQDLRAENLRLKAELRTQHGLDRVVGVSPAMASLFEMVRSIAPTSSTVLITGESGTGKELVARAIHALSPRRDAPFVSINCGALPDTLLESELFGHMKGAYTDAHQNKKGLFEAAHRGTLFLDEVGETSPSMQVKLLRALQEKRIRRLGGTDEVEVDVRVISATNVPLESLIREKRFREDLFYRLQVIPIRTPALRERREDIPLLAELFLKRFAHEMGKGVVKISEDAMSRLIRYAWPGNVRELENVIERAVALETTEAVLTERLPEAVRSTDRPAPSRITMGNGFSLDEHLRRVEADLLGQALQETGGERAAAAQLLGVTGRSLRYLIQKHGLGGVDKN